jgi:hypothetical protein
MAEKVGKGRKVSVTGAEFQERSYLDDLTTAGTLRTGHTNANDWHGLHAQGTHNPRSVPGLQIDGYFPDDSTTIKAQEHQEPEPPLPPAHYYDAGNAYGNNKYPHDSQFVIRLPYKWNGKLVITSAPGVRGQYANDFIIGDYVLAKGYAFAATDKGNSGLQFSRAKFYRNGKKHPGSAVAEWHRRVRELTNAAKDTVEGYYGEEPYRTYITGISNGGYLTRFALENDPNLYNGGVDWEGPLWLPGGPNLLTFLPKALKHFPTSEDEEMSKAGFDKNSKFLWRYYWIWYWRATQRIFREEFDPNYEGSEDDYDYTKRPQEVKEAVTRVSLTGDISKPLITLHGTLDGLLPITKTSDKYAELVNNAGRSDLHRYYRIEGSTHVDSLYDHAGFRDKLRPILPYYRAAFEALEKWVEEGCEPPDEPA